MPSSKRILLFGDLTADTSTAIKDLTRQSRQSLTLRTFFQNVTDALQTEIAGLHTRERQRFHAFDSILGLAEAHDNGRLDVVVSAILLCAAQLGTLIV